MNYTSLLLHYLEYKTWILLWICKGVLWTQRRSKYTWKRIPLLTHRVSNFTPTLYEASHDLVRFLNKVSKSQISKAWHLYNRSSSRLHYMRLRDLLELEGDLNNQHNYAYEVFHQSGSQLTKFTKEWRSSINPNRVDVWYLDYFLSLHPLLDTQLVWDN